MKKILQTFGFILIVAFNLVPLTKAQIYTIDQTALDPVYVEPIPVYEINTIFYDPYLDPLYDPDAPTVTPDPTTDPNLTTNPDQTTDPDLTVTPDPTVDPALTQDPNYTAPIPEPPPEDPNSYVNNEPAPTDSTTTDTSTTDPTTTETSNTGDPTSNVDASLLDYPERESILIPEGGLETQPREPQEPQPEETPPEEEIDEREQPVRPVIVNPEPGEVIDNVIPKVTKSQLNIFLVILIGLVAGTLVWIITGLIINSAQANRETKRMKRQTAQSIREQKIDQLKTVYNPIQNALSEIDNAINAKSFSKQNLDEYKKASVEIELFGSEKTIEAHKEMIKVLSGPKKPTEEDFNKTKNNLLQALKADLGL